MPAELAAGPIEEAVTARLAFWARESISRRIWAKDPTVWAETDLPELTDRLGWLSLPTDMAGHIDDLQQFGEECATDFDHAVVLGMGGSSLAPEVFQATFGNSDGHPRLHVLDSTHPEAVRDLAASIDMERTLFLVSSKSGTTIETLSFMRFFWDALGPGSHRPEQFVAITDPGSPLVDIARERSFRRIFETPPEVGGRFSAFTYFGLIPAAVIGVDLGRLLEAAATGAWATGPQASATEDPGMHIAAFWAEAALAGRNKLTFSTSPGLSAFPDWLEQLIAESTGKDRTGIVPVVGEPLAGPATYGDDRAFFHYHLTTDGLPPEELAALGNAGYPVYILVLEDKYGMGEEMFYAEMATAAAGAALGIHPFNQPDVQLAKELARSVMDGEPLGGGSIAEVTTDIGGEITRFLSGGAAGDYIGLQEYLPATSATRDAFARLRLEIRDRTRLATTVGFGPRFLHSTGQLHKGGPRNGLFVQVVDGGDFDLAVPETDFTFRELISAQAEGDFRALRDRGQRIMRVRLDSAEPGELNRLMPGR